jgi:hypothetical protein
MISNEIQFTVRMRFSATEQCQDLIWCSKGEMYGDQLGEDFSVGWRRWKCYAIWNKN